MKADSEPSTLLLKFSLDNDIPVCNVDAIQELADVLVADLAAVIDQRCRATDKLNVIACQDQLVLDSCGPLDVDTCANDSDSERQKRT